MRGCNKNGRRVLEEDGEKLTLSGKRHTLFPILTGWRSRKTELDAVESIKTV